VRTKNVSRMAPRHDAAETAGNDVPLVTRIAYLQLGFGVCDMHEAYQPVIDDGRGRFPENFFCVKAPRGARAAIAAAAQIQEAVFGVAEKIGPGRAVA